jgi:hypothetical protein
MTVPNPLSHYGEDMCSPGETCLYQDFFLAGLR